MRYLFLVLIIILSVISVGLIGIIIINFILPNKIIIEIIKNASPKNNSVESETKITIMAVGDIMLDRGVEYMVKKYGNNSFKFPFMLLAEDLKKADILLGNLESVISDKGQKVGSIYSFRAEPSAIEGLTYAGFDVLSVANNHIFDYGRAAMEDSFNRLKQAGINYVGGGFNEKEVHSGVLKEIKGTKIIFLAYNNQGSKHWKAEKDSSGISWLDEGIKEDIKNAKEKSDLVIVSFHFGDEYQKEPNDSQKYFAHLAIDSGADLVIGHHPHVVQSAENYKDKWIFYSLGNFIFDQGEPVETMKGLLLKIVIEDKKIKEVIPKEIKISEFFQPYFSF